MYIFTAEPPQSCSQWEDLWSESLSVLERLEAEPQCWLLVVIRRGESDVVLQGLFARKKRQTTHLGWNAKT